MKRARQKVVPINRALCRRTEQPCGSEKCYRLLVENVVDYAIFMLDPEGYVVSWNPGAEKLKGYCEEEILGRHFSCFFPPEDIERRVPEQILEAAKSAGRLATQGWRVRKDGSPFWADVVVTALYDASGALCGFGKVTRDLTERKRAEQEIQDLNERLACRTSELESAKREMESLLCAMSHDLRTPLRHVEGAARLVLDDLTSAYGSIARLNDVAQSAVKLGDLAADLAAYAQTNRLTPKTVSVDLNKVVEDARDEARKESASGYVAWNFAPLPAVRGDPALLRVAFANLLSNAIKFSRHRDPAIIEVASYPDERGAIVVFVRDNGTGFDPRFSHRLFGVFQRLHPEEEFEGAGIGLATVKRIVERHGGKVWAEGEPDHGATFFISLKHAD